MADDMTFDDGAMETFKLRSYLQPLQVERDWVRLCTLFDIRIHVPRSLEMFFLIEY